MFTLSCFLHIYIILLFCPHFFFNDYTLSQPSKLQTQKQWHLIPCNPSQRFFSYHFFFFIISSSSLGWNWSASTLNLNYMNIFISFSMCRLCLVSERKKKLLGGKETDEIQKEKKKGWKNELKENKLNIRGSGIHALKLAYTWCSIPSVCQFPWTNDNHTPRAGLIQDLTNRIL